MAAKLDNNTGPEPKIEELPYDQFSRLYWVSTLIDELRDGQRNKHMRVLDIGGNHGFTARFLPQDNVKVLDLEGDAIDPDNFIKGDGTNIPLPNDGFDLAVSFETYEHIPRAMRQKYLDEMLRVSKLGFFLSAPFDAVNGLTSKSEKVANDFYKELMGHDHRWLREHIDLVTPKITEIKAQLDNQGSYYCNLTCNDLSLWLMLLEFHFLAEHELQPELVRATQDVNNYYNKHINELDIVPEQKGYRQIFFVSKIKKNKEAVARRISGLVDGHRVLDENRAELVNMMNRAIFHAIKAKDTKIGLQANVLNNTLNELSEQRLVGSRLRSELDNIYSSRTWKIVAKVHSLINRIDKY